MLFVAIGLWIISLLIIIIKPHNKNLKLLSLFAFVAGISGIVGMIASNARELSTFFNTNIDNIYFIQKFLSTIPYYIGPFIALSYGISCYDEKKRPLLLYIVLFIPVVVSYLLLPFKAEQQLSIDEISKVYIFLSIWAVPYLFTTNIFIILRTFKERNSLNKNYWKLTTITSVPFIFFSMLSNYFLRIFNIAIWDFFAILIPIAIYYIHYFSI